QPEPKEYLKEYALHVSLFALGLNRQRKDVAHAADTFDAFCSVAVHPNLFSQVTNMRVDAAVERREFTSKDFSYEFLPAHDAACRLHKFFEEIKLDCR